jgi:hypothetical protein
MESELEIDKDSRQDWNRLSAESERFSSAVQNRVDSQSHHGSMLE